MEMNMKGMRNLMKEAQKMQERLQQEMSELRIEATSGGGMVEVVMDGSKQLLSLRIDPQAVDPSDSEMLQDLILAAINEAGRKVDEALGSRLGNFGGLIP